jgi:hypothetical protein
MVDDGDAHLSRNIKNNMYYAYEMLLNGTPWGFTRVGQS